MPDFRRLGQVLYGWHRHRNFGGGQHEGFKWDRSLTFEKGFLVDNPTGFNSIAGAGSAQLSVEAAAAIRGNYGYQVNITNTNDRYGILALNTYAQFQLDYLFDMNSLTMANNDIFDKMRIGDGGGTKLFNQFQYTAAAGYRVRLIARNDGGGNEVGNYIAVPDEACQIRIRWKAADFAGANNGFARLFVNNVEAGGIEDIDNDTIAMTFANIGAAGGLDAGTSGPIFYDNIRFSGSFNG